MTRPAGSRLTKEYNGSVESLCRSLKKVLCGCQLLGKRLWMSLVVARGQMTDSFQKSTV